MSGSVLTSVVTATIATATISAPQSTELPEAPPLFAVIVGNNHPLPGSDYTVLKYADDDALRMATYLESLGTHVFLLTSPDAESARRFPIANRARIPTRAMLDATIDEVHRALKAVADRSPELIFYFSGHGTITAADAYLHLVDGPFSRTDLQERVLARMPSHRTHVIIDSCHSYFLVNARGERVPAAFDDQSLDRFSNTGFLLSTSADVEVQEWSGYQAGVFSYQVLGALQGAADVDLDGIITYAEVHAYLVAANLGVRNAEVRIQPFVRPPTVRGRALLDIRRVDPGRRLRVPPSIDGHFYITDGAGRRILDANKPADAPLSLVTDPGRALYVVAGHSSYEVEAVGPGRGVGRAVPKTERTATRGPLADEFRRSLFKRPLTTEFVAGVEAMATRSPSVRLDPRHAPSLSWYKDGLTVGVLSAGFLAASLGTAAAILFQGASSDADARPVTADVERARLRAEDFRALTVGSFSVSGALLIVGLLRAAFTNEAFSGAAP